MICIIGPGQPQEDGCLNNYLAGQNNYPIFSFLFTLLIMYIEKNILLLINVI